MQLFYRLVVALNDLVKGDGSVAEFTIQRRSALTIIKDYEHLGHEFIERVLVVCQGSPYAFDDMVDVKIGVHQN
jgi:hypothetical protein